MYSYWVIVAVVVKTFGNPSGSSWMSLDTNYENQWISSCCSCSETDFSLWTCSIILVFSCRLQVTAKFAIMFITVQYNVTQVLGELKSLGLLFCPFSVLAFEASATHLRYLSVIWVLLLHLNAGSQLHSLSPACSRGRGGVGSFRPVRG